jgi:predicted DNA-binding WGR domain protein
VLPGLFDEWSIIKEWGRVGSPGTVRKEWFATEQEAEVASQALSDKKIKKGYRLK